MASLPRRMEDEMRPNCAFCGEEITQEDVAHPNCRPDGKVWAERLEGGYRYQRGFVDVASMESEG